MTRWRRRIKCKVHRVMQEKPRAAIRTTFAKECWGKKTNLFLRYIYEFRGAHSRVVNLNQLARAQEGIYYTTIWIRCCDSHKERPCASCAPKYEREKVKVGYKMPRCYSAWFSKIHGRVWPPGCGSTKRRVISQLSFPSGLILQMA